MQRETYNTDDIGVSSFVIILDEMASVFLDQQGITDPNGYMVGLLEAERRRQQEGGRKPGEPGQNLNALLEETPDTSGYPEMQGHFEGPEHYSR